MEYRLTDEVPGSYRGTHLVVRKSDERARDRAVLGDVIRRHIAERAAGPAPVRAMRIPSIEQAIRTRSSSGMPGVVRKRRNHCSMSSFSAWWRSFCASCSNALWFR